MKALYLRNMGVICAVGLRSEAVAAAVRAGVARTCESPFQLDDRGPLVLSYLSDEQLPKLRLARNHLAIGNAYLRRLVRLGGSALSECLEGTQAPSQIPILLASARRLVSATGGAGFLPALRAQAGASPGHPKDRILCGGRAGGVEALKDAFGLLESGSCTNVIVGGVDSWFDTECLQETHRQGRLGDIDSFIPGEAAAFVCVGREPPTSWPGVRIHMPGFGYETGSWGSEQAHRGDGLAEALRAALQDFGGSIEHTYCSMNGESFWSREWGVAFLRNQQHFQESLLVEHPAECVGDVGAAFAPFLMAEAAWGMVKQYRPGPALVWCASDGPQRGAFVLSISQKEK